MPEDYEVKDNGSIIMGGKEYKKCQFYYGISWPQVTPGYLVAGAVGHLIERELAAVVDTPFLLILQEYQQNTLEELTRDMVSAYGRFAPGPLYQEGGQLGAALGRRGHAIAEDGGMKVPGGGLLIVRAPYSQSPSYALGVMRSWFQAKTVCISATCPTVIEHLKQIQSCDPGEIEKNLPHKWYAVAALSHMASGCKIDSGDYGLGDVQPRVALSYGGPIKRRKKTAHAPTYM